ncbi:RNA polymerase sigma factor, partial [Thermodesulfobacteriota bacterium]
MTHASPDDREILGCLLSGDRAAAELFVQRFSNLIYHSIQHVFKIRHLAYDPAVLEDLHNTVFLLLFENDCRKLRQYQGRNGCSLATWIRLIAVRSMLNYFRKKGFDAVSGRNNRMSLEDIPELCSDKSESEKALENS